MIYYETTAWAVRWRELTPEERARRLARTRSLHEGAQAAQRAESLAVLERHFAEQADKPR